MPANALSSPSARPASRAGRRLLALLLAAAPLAAGCAGQTAKGAPQGAATAAGEPAAAAATAAPATKANPYAAYELQPPDGKWLTDDKGDKYFIRDYPKKEGSYYRLPDGRVRVPGGLTFKPERETDDTFFYRYYKTPDWVPEDRRTPSPEELAAAEATYKVEAGEASGLSLERIGSGLPVEGQWRNGFDLVDMDGDGKLDILHGPARKSLGPPVVFLGDGQGGFKRWAAHFPDLPYDYGDAVAGDLDGDGHPDIVLGAHLRGLMALVGDGQGNFRDWGKGLDFELPGKGGDASGFSSHSLALADWNGDGRLDILALGEGPRLNLGPEGPRPGSSLSFGVLVYLNQGDGTWKRTGGLAREGLFGDGLVVADFDGDGRLDFATGSAATGRKDLIGLGRPDGTWQAVEIPSLRKGVLARSVAAADFDGDGRTELAVGYLNVDLGVWRTGIDVFEMQADGTWQRRALAVQPGRDGVTALAAGDLDSDGRKDLVALTGKGATWVFTNDGKGFLARQKAAEPPVYPEGCTGYHLALGDLDGRPGDEIVSSFAGETTSALSAQIGLIAGGRCSSEGGFQAWRVAPAGARAR